MKRIHLSFRAWLVSLAALLAALPACTDVTLDQLVFTEVDGGYSISAKSGKTLEGALVIPDTYNGNPVVEIGNYAFQDCDGLTSIHIPDAVTTIRKLSFSYSKSLTSVHVGNGVTAIGNDAFEGCYSLTQIEVSESNTAYCSVDGVLYNKAKDTIICYPAGRQGEFSIPDAVTTIGNEAFAYCSGLTSITISDAVTTIGNEAFYNCSGLTSITISDAVTTIGNEAFFNCYGLTSVHIGDGVTTIGNRAFINCSGLTEITCSATEPPSFDTYSPFNDFHYKEATVYVPEEAVETYRRNKNWRLFQNIVSAAAVYDLRGTKVAASPEGLPRGTYIVRQGGKSKKISVK